MKENSSESPFVEEMGGGDAPATPADEAVPPTPLEMPAAVQPEDKSIRLEAEISYLRDRVADANAAFTALRQQTRRLMVVGLLLAGLCGFAVVKMSSRNAKQANDLKAVADQIVNLKAGPGAASVPAPDHSPHVFSVTFSHWEQGQPPVRLIRRVDGFCVLTKVVGHFEGGGESVRLWIDTDGYWYLGGESHQQGIGAECAVVLY